MKTQAPVRTESERRRAGAGGRGVPKEQGRNWRR
jgi:transposase-like protein